LLLLPSIFFIYKVGYTKKSYQANIYFFIWTQLGSLLVLVGVSYIYIKTGTTNFINLKNFNFLESEKYFLYLIFFFGFGVKVPLWPLHFWLIKVHVEAPSGFSIFLSGFLVKTAIYCFYKTTLILNIKTFYIIPVLFCILGLVDSSLKMWAQIDIKKLIAYATVQEMNAIYLLFNFGDSWAINAGLIFLLAHGILSALMFFLVECIYKRYNSRSLYKIYGVSQLYPNLSLAIWGMLLLFFGFPGTIKFLGEIQLCFLLAYNDFLSTFILLLVFIFINSLGFARCWFSILYGHPGYNKPNMDLTKEETLIIIYLIFLSLISCCFIFLI
jgi:NADH-quinone oxidoreductase subunit M